MEEAPQRPTLPIGHRVVVSELAETPLEAIERQMSLVEMPAPDPAALGPADVLVAVKSASVGWVDLIMTSGQYQHLPKPPYCPGLEYAGVVAWTGARRSTPSVARVGDPGAGRRLSRRARARSAPTRPGAASRRTRSRPPRRCDEFPAASRFDQACNLLGNYETAFHCLVTRGKLKPARRC